MSKAIKGMQQKRTTEAVKYAILIKVKHLTLFYETDPLNQDESPSVSFKLFVIIISYLVFAEYFTSQRSATKKRISRLIKITQ